MTETQQLRQSVSKWRALTLIVTTVQLSGWMFILGCGSGSENSGVVNTDQLPAAQADAKDEIVCKKLTIVDVNGKEIATLGRAFEGAEGATLKIYGRYPEVNWTTVSQSGLAARMGNFQSRLDPLVGLSLVLCQVLIDG